jgi:hypothetical protein
MIGRGQFRTVCCQRLGVANGPGARVGTCGSSNEFTGSSWCARCWVSDLYIPDQGDGKGSLTPQLLESVLGMELRDELDGVLIAFRRGH